MTQEKAIERSHSLKITSGEMIDGRKDIDDVGKFVMTNSVTGKEHELTMWAYGLASNHELVDVDIYSASPEELIRMTDEGMDIEDAYYHSAKLNSLGDFITIEKDDEIRPDIRTYTFNPTAKYEYDIPTTDLKMDLHDLIVKEEIGDLIIMKEQNTLTKEDVLDFGKLVRGDDTSYDLGDTLKEPIQNLLKENRFDAEELALIKGAAKTLGAEVDVNSPEIAKEMQHKVKAPGKDEIEHSR